MYDVKPNLVIGFHGCDASVRDLLLKDPNKIVISREPYDWLGHGLYFWENNFERALQWAEDKKRRGKIINPAVIGAVLQLGYCCDFLEARFIRMIERYYRSMAASYRANGKEIPKNEDLTEGGPAFEGSGLHAKTHIQICIRNMNCIKGFFLPRREIDFVRSLQAG
jgi:hypothetical protein